jgi:hypothetical protein
MHPLPPPTQLAALVSTVTKTMLGISFEPDQDPSREPLLRWRTAVLPIAGSVPLTVGLSSDESGCATLSSAMFACPRDEVDAGMMNDSLCELVNMTAGLIKTTLALDQALGLPKVLGPGELAASPGNAGNQAVILKAEGVGLVLWICEGLV